MEIQCKIESLSSGAAGVARTDQGVVFIPNTVPGDVVRARIVSTKRRYREAELLEVIERSPHRREAPCRYVPKCGGCSWQVVDDETQIAAKQQNLEETLRRIGGFDSSRLELSPVLCPRTWGTRHRVQFRVDGEQRLGFYRHASHELVQIRSCLAADGTINAHFPVARAWLAGASTTVRRLEIATASPGRVVLVANAEGPFRNDGGYHETFLARHPSVLGIVLFGKGWRRDFGNPTVEVTVEEGLSIAVTGGFTQVNPEANRLLVQTTIELAQPHEHDDVLDLYCGAGNLTLPMARRARSVTGVERDRRALADARDNARRNETSNCRFRGGDCGPIVQGLAKGGARFSLVLLDPPRSGAATVLPAIVELSPDRIVYVSCDPPTLARDLRTLANAGYRLGRIQPIDLFPQTWHLETVVRLDRNS